MVSSSKWAVPDWKSVTAWRMASTVDWAVGWCWDSRSLAETFVAEHLAGGVDGVDDAVGEEDDEVAGAGGEGELFVLGVGEEAEGKAFGLDGADAGGLGGVGVGGDEEGLDGAGVGDLEGLVAVVPDGHEHGDVLGVELALLELVVEGGEHGCG